MKDSTKLFLREDDRFSLKYGVDYTSMTKYGEVHLFTCEMFKESLEEGMKACGEHYDSITVLRYYGGVKNYPRPHYKAFPVTDSADYPCGTLEGFDKAYSYGPDSGLYALAQPREKAKRFAHGGIHLHPTLGEVMVANIHPCGGVRWFLYLSELEDHPEILKWFGFL
ncbi:MAG: hypothetical protein OEY01_03405 [Desulfobulbaceae bacterium]|nr:hypothetical protein [Desulfobulbaceae bacterium]